MLADRDPQCLADVVRRIGASTTFRRSPRQVRLLQHIVERAVAHDVAALREISLGLELFGRDPATFDPQVDAIVRVEVGRLRRKLARYYEGEGRDDDIEVTLPIGNYFPVIRRRTAVAMDGRPSIAVLPFANLTGNPRRESLCEALADSLIEALGRLSGIKVIARTSTFQFRARRVDAGTIGQQLGANLLLHASLQHSLDKLTIAAQLIATATGDALWSQMFIGTSADVVIIQETIAHAIVKFLGLSVAHSSDDTDRLPQERLAKVSRSISLEARDLFERGAYLGRRGSSADWRKAIRLLDRALALEPNYAAAHAERALALKNLVSSLHMPADEGFADIRHGIDCALALDPTLAVAHRVRVQLSLMELDWADAHAHAQRALQVAPSSAIAHVAYGEWLYASGRFGEAEREWELAREFDPLHGNYRQNMALLYMLWRRYERSEKILLDLLELDAHHGGARSLLTMLYLMARKWRKAITSAEESIRLAPDHPALRLNLAQAFAGAGNAREARRVLRDAEVRFGVKSLSPFQQGQLNVHLGELDEAFGQFEVAISRRTAAVYHLPLDPGLEHLHRDSRWIAMMTRHGFPSIDTSGWRVAAIEEWRGEGGTLLDDT